MWLGLWVAPVGVYLAVTALLWSGMWSGSGCAVTGDEPHYLRIAESLVADGDLVVANNMRIRLEGGQVSREITGHVLDSGYSVHSVGLALLLTPAYWLAGAWGAKIFLALLAGMWPAVLYRTIRLIVASRAWALCLALLLSLGLPFVVASNQIYPDLLGGMIILYTVTTLMQLGSAQCDAGKVAGSWLLSSLLTAYLPWLHIRFAAPAVILLMASCVLVTRTRCTTASQRWLLLLTGLGYVASFGLLAYYNYSYSGFVLGHKGSESISFELEKVMAVLLGLHLDQAQGLFVQQPLFLMGLLGIVYFAKVNWRLACLVGAVYCSVLLPNAMHPNWYGGHSFQGRYWWAAVGLWVFPLSYATNLLRTRFGRMGEIGLGLACVLSLGWQLALASVYLAKPGALYNSKRLIGFPVWQRPGILRELFEANVWLRLPYFHEFDDYYQQLPNYVAVLGCLVLVTQGWLMQRKTAAPRLLTASSVRCPVSDYCDSVGGAQPGEYAHSVVALNRWSRHIPLIGWVAVVVGLAMIWLTPPKLNPVSLTADRLPGLVGVVNGTARVAQANTAPGFLTFGPYLRLPPGDYEAELMYTWQPVSDPPARWDIAFDVPDDSSPLQIAQSGNLAPSIEGERSIRRRFTVSTDEADSGVRMQFRVHYPGHGELTVEGLQIAPLAIRLPGVQQLDVY